MFLVGRAIAEKFVSGFLPRMLGSSSRADLGQSDKEYGFYPAAHDSTNAPYLSVVIIIITGWCSRPKNSAPISTTHIHNTPAITVIGVPAYL